MASPVKAENRIDVVVPAAGQGKRMKCEGNKLFQQLKGVPIIYRTLFRLSRLTPVHRIIVVIRRAERDQFSAMFREFGELDKQCIVIDGGAERYDSVRNGLRCSADDSESN